MSNGIVCRCGATTMPDPEDLVEKLPAIILRLEEIESRLGDLLDQADSMQENVTMLIEHIERPIDWKDL